MLDVFLIALGAFGMLASMAVKLLAYRRRNAQDGKRQRLRLVARPGAHRTGAG